MLSFNTVPKTGFLVLKLNGLTFSGGATGDGSGAACPFLGHSCFQNKCFAVFRGCNRRQWGIGMSLFRAFLFLEKSFCQNRDIKWPKTAQNGPKWPKTTQNCIIIYAHVPFWAILILNLNVLPKSGHAILCVFFITCTHA